MQKLERGRFPLFDSIPEIFRSPPFLFSPLIMSHILNIGHQPSAHNSQQPQKGAITMASQEPRILLRYTVIVAYDGTRFKGFQRQSSGDDKSALNTKGYKRRRLEDGGKAAQVPLTIQECLEDALEKYTGLGRLDLKMRFAGRTDAGVHARGQVLVVSLPDDLGELWHIRKSINSRLPVDISIDKLSVCENQDINPRSDVKRKQYSYTLKYRRKMYSNDGELLPICTSGPQSIRSGLDPAALWVCPWALDDSQLDELCRRLTGDHDYSAFVHRQARRDKENALTVERLVCERLHETKEDAPVMTVRFEVEAKGFRRSMVRNLVGFLVDICRGTVEESIFETLWTGTDEVADKVHSAPACGLCLEHVLY
jgi:tRNA pseudouridine38-40 synthase